MLKQIMIPVAAFAVTVAGASAFNSDALQKLDLGLTDTQVSAIEEVHNLKDSGATREEVKAILDEAGLDREKMQEVRKAMHEVRETQHEAVDLAIANNDYDAFVVAIADSPLADKITSEADFQKFAEAQALRKSGDREGADKIMLELGIEKPAGHGQKGGERGFGGPGHGDRQSAEAE